MDLDFEGNGNVQGVQTPATGTTTNSTTPDSTPIDGAPDVDDVTAKDGDTKPSDGTTPVEKNDDTTIPHSLEVGTQIEFDGANYKVADNGDIVDDKGNVFKEAKDVKAWLDENNTESDDDSELSLTAIQNAIGISVTDEQGNPVEFTNDAKGVKSYVDSVINMRSADIQKGAINKLFNDMPMLKEFIDYVQLTGSPRGFGDIPDRSGIVLDKNNEAQLISVIRMAAQEFGNGSLNDNYIAYLKSSGALYDEAKAQLGNLVAKDQQVKKQIEANAAAARQAEEEEMNAYWNAVSNTIANRNIAGYKLPESFVKEINGKKYTLTPDDFFSYLTRQTEVDDEGNPITAYRRDLDKMSDDEVLNRDLLDAWLMFTGGTYKDLVDMAVKENDVKKLVIKSKAARTQHTVKINKANKGKSSIDDIIF